MLTILTIGGVIFRCRVFLLFILFIYCQYELFEGKKKQTIPTQHFSRQKLGISAYIKYIFNKAFVIGCLKLITVVESKKKKNFN